ncbi:hypothetical protein ACQKWADRAFT_307797 [Trichoderma austrokoningii]
MGIMVANGSDHLARLSQAAISLGEEEVTGCEAFKVPSLLSTKLVECHKDWEDSILFHLGEPYSLEYLLLGNNRRAQLVLHLVFARLDTASVFSHYLKRLIPGGLIVFSDHQLLDMRYLVDVDPELLGCATSLVLFCPGVLGHLEGPLYFAEVVSKVVGLTSPVVRLCEETFSFHSSKLHGKFIMPRIGAEVVDEENIDLWMERRRDVFGRRIHFKKLYCRL